MAASADVAINFSKSKTEQLMEHLLDEFRTSSKCCMELPKYLAWTKPLKSQLKELFYYIHQQNGIKYIKVYKTFCNCYPGEVASFKLTDMSRKLVFTYLKNNPLQQKEKKESFPYSVDNDLPPKCKVPTYRFSVGTTHDPMLAVPPGVSKGYANQFFYPIHHRKEEILEAIRENRIVAIIGNAAYKKSTQVPQFILEDSSEKGLHCRVISSHNHRISAMTDCENVSYQRGEQVGSTVAYQIHLESKSSAKTNLLYTTTSFLLRCLMSTSMLELFQGVTHLIINDMHEMDAHTDFLLMELKSNIECHPSLKIIFMGSSMNTKIFENYFKLVKIIELQEISGEVTTFHLDEIMHITGQLVHLQQAFDNGMDSYLLSGNQYAFEYILNFIRTGQLSVNTRRTRLLTTPLIAAVRRNRADHLKTLIELKGNPYLVDCYNKSAFDWATIMQDSECMSILLEYHTKFFVNSSCSHSEQLVSGCEYADISKQGIDHDLLFKLITFVNQSVQDGTVLVFLPSYMDIIKQQSFLTKGIRAGILSNVKLYILHENITEDEARSISEVYPTHRKIVLSTSLAEAAFSVQYVGFVIDSGKRLDVNNEYFWISLDSMNRRASLAGNSMLGLCFRLYYKENIESFTTSQMPSFNVNKLSRLSLYVKLLSQYNTVKDYFSNSCKAPSAQGIDESLKLLTQIGALDEQENITNMGIRLVDIPVDIQLGKVLLFAIVLQCLDPVLTIVSALTFQEPLNLKDYEACDGRTIISRANLAEGTNSDHMVLLRLYQTWQDKRMPDINIDLPLNEILLNGLLEAICGIRIQIVGTLRAAGLVHSTGLLSMQSLNVQSNNWALVKACFVGGMYPNICKVDRKSLEIKTHTDVKTSLHSSSVLCENRQKDENTDVVMPYQTEWIVFQENIKDSHGNTNVKYASLVTPILIALFGGKSKMVHDELNAEIDFTCLDDQNELNAMNTTFNVDEWISFVLSSEDAHLLFNLRQKFFLYFQDLLQNCEVEKLQKYQLNLESKSLIVDVISKLIFLEESANNLPLPQKVGERPRALPMRFVSVKTCNNLKLINDMQSMNPFKPSQNVQSAIVLNTEAEMRHFYIINIECKEEAQNYFDMNISQNHYDCWERLVLKTIQFPYHEIFVFLLDNSSKTFCAVGQMKMTQYDFYLQPIAKIDVPYTILEGMFQTWQGHYSGSFESYEIPPIVGNSFLAFCRGGY